MSKPMSPGRADAHDRVEVGSVVVERRPHLVHDLGDLLDARLEQPQRRGIGQHQAGHLLVGLGPQVVEVDVALVVGGHLDDLVAGHRHRGRIRAVRVVGREHLGSLLAAILVERAREQHAGQLAVRAGRGLQRDVRQAGDLAQGVLQAPHELERALGLARILEGMQAGVAGQGGHPFVQLGVVLHRARPERDRSRCRDRSCAWTAGCSGGRSRARRPRAGGPARARRSSGGSSSSRSRSGTSSAGATNARRPGWERW